LFSILLLLAVAVVVETLVVVVVLVDTEIALLEKQLAVVAVPSTAGKLAGRVQSYWQYQRLIIQGQHLVLL
jgi:NADH:ubiquinone oxidoreductase subunit K